MADRRPFVHLHCHTHYSLLDGASRVPELVERVKSLGMNACAITDHGNLYGAIEFYKECKAATVNPIIGYEAYVAPGKRTDREAKRRGDAGYHLTLMAHNITGFKNLIKMSSIAYLEGYHYIPRIDKELLAAHSEGLVCLSGCASSEFSEAILSEQMKDAAEIAAWFSKVFGKNFYIEIQNNGLEVQKKCAKGAIEIANKMGLPLVATCDAHYLTREDAPAHDVLLCINTGKLRSDTKRIRYGNDDGNMIDQFYVRPPEEMYQLFPEHHAAVKRSQEIADGCDIQIDFKKRHFPVFVPPSGKTPEQFLRELCEVGLKERYGDKISEQVRARIEHELGIICRMGFASYFLIVADFVRFAVEKGIPCSARGSACGALVSYVLKLSHVDPLEYDLLFERFLDPNRSEAPDIDIDFCQNRREEVIAYVKQKYGEASVAQIATFGTMAAKAAIKDVGRVLNVPLQRVLQLTDMVPKKPIGVTIDQSLEMNPDLRGLYTNDPEVHELIDIARSLEGTNRQTGIHAAGVVIANGNLTDYVPLHRAMRKGEDTSRAGEPVLVTQWVMGDLEKVGLLKMDFLGLRTLTLLEDAVKLIEKTRGEKVDIYKLPLDDPETYALLQRGDAKGVFQFESDGIRELLKRLKPDNIRDIIACTALYRPGPLDGGMVDDYINFKHGRATPVYPHPVMEEVLAETYGVLCIHEDALISMADGTEKPIREVRALDRVHSLNREAQQFEYKECHGCGPTRRGDGRRITLDNGFHVTLTDDHQVLTYEGFKEAQHLDPEKDLVCVGLRLTQECPSSADIAPWLGEDEDVAYLFGQLVGDGCLTSTGITIATGEQKNHEQLVRWFQARLPSVRLAPYYHLRSWYLTLSQPDLLNQPGHGNRKTRLHHLLDVHGLKTHAKQKRIPEVIFRAPRLVRAAFLAGLLDSDGCLAETGNGAAVAFFTSASPALIDGIRRLCQMEGLSLRVTNVRVHVWDVAGLRALVEPYLILKQFKGKQTRGKASSWVPRRVVFEAIPAGESLRSFCARTRLERSGLSYDYPFVKTATALKAGVAFGDARYQRITSIERVHDQQFYGMSVADHHNLVAGGIVVKNCYQEQIMRILNRQGGIELASAYACIKAISKKKQDIIDARRGDFLKGAQERGVTADKAEEIFGLIEKFGAYGFNKSHSAAYAYVSYQTAYLKAHYPAEFMAALLTSEIDDGNKRDIMVDHIADAKKQGVAVIPPTVNRSETTFSVVENQIVFGLAAIKGCGRQSTDAIVRARNEGKPFRDIFDFCERIDHKLVPKGAIEKMIKAGALDCFRGHRAQQMAVLPRAFKAAEESREDRKRGQLSMFGGPTAESNGTAIDDSLPEVEPWSKTEQLKYEKEVLDFYLSSHPLAEREQEIARYASHTIAGLVGVPGESEVRIGGLLTQIRLMTYKKPQRNGNTRYGRCKVEDLTGVLESVMWGDEFIRYKDLFVDDQEPVLVIGKLERKTDEPILQITRILTVEQATKEQATALNILFRLGQQSLVDLDIVANILRKTPGACPVVLVIKDSANRNCVMKLSREFNINPATYLKSELVDILGQGSVRLT